VAIRDLRLAAVERPAERRALISPITKIQARAALGEQPHHVRVAGQRRLMQSRRVRVESLWVGAVRILAGIAEQPHHVRVAVLGRKSKSGVPALGVSGR
jgi:hypothetical protein